MVKPLFTALRLFLSLCLKYLLLMLVVTAFIFFLLRLAPLDPVGLLMSPTSTPADILNIKHRLGLDLPLWEQYCNWLAGLLQGRAGNSYVSGEGVITLVTEALPVTLLLVIMTLFFSVICAFLLGGLAFYYRGKRLSVWIDQLNNIFLCIPDFLWSIVLIFIFGITLHLLPVFGLVDPALDLQGADNQGVLVQLILGGPSAWLNLAAHLILPITALVMGITPLQMKNLFNQLTFIYQQDYIRYAQLRGQSRLRLLVVQAVPNAFPAALALLSNQASMLVGGTLLVETLFGLPGLGLLIIKALNNQDLPLIEGISLCYILLVILIQLISRAMIFRVDPRLKANT